MLSGTDAGSVIDAEPKHYDSEYDLTQFVFPGGELWVPGRYERSSRGVRLRIAARDVSLCMSKPDNTTILNIITAEVDEVHRSASASALIRLRAGDDFLLAQVTRRSVARLDLKKGDRLFAQVKSVTVKR